MSNENEMLRAWNQSRKDTAMTFGAMLKGDSLAAIYLASPVMTKNIVTTAASADAAIKRLDAAEERAEKAAKKAAEKAEKARAAAMKAREAAAKADAAANG